ncbi:4-oxalocrotonate tautomerase [Ectobacillus ponti]|uniref:Tautomerase n=1 Tax=Ectobacillus ponti TaxID=2961894 RepID=A0AA41X853_9BACI|nr:4-oxalocrotonate tautomerase [Ectobacillus ponti]MCP8970507.1 4-oxalocrotonate tautomerase [Ectobacillus ponti]
MPLIHIQMLEGRPEEKVTNLIQQVTETVSATLEAPKESIRVIVTEIPRTHWGVGGIPMSELKR